MGRGVFPRLWLQVEMQKQSSSITSFLASLKAHLLIHLSIHSNILQSKLCSLGFSILKMQLNFKKGPKKLNLYLETESHLAIPFTTEYRSSIRFLFFFISLPPKLQICRIKHVTAFAWSLHHWERFSKAMEKMGISPALLYFCSRHVWSAQGRRKRSKAAPGRLSPISHHLITDYK